MNDKLRKYLELINLRLKDTSFIYFSKDVERGLGLENYIDNYFICSIERSYITESLSRNSFYPKNFNSKKNSTLELVKDRDIQNKIKGIVKDSKFFAQFFQFSQPAIKVLESIGGKVLNNDSILNREFEDKILQFNFFKKNNIKTPDGVIVTLLDQSYPEIVDNVNSTSFVVQLSRGHTGTGTFIIHNEIDFKRITELYKGNEVRISKFINGKTYTVNGCVTKKGIFVAGLQLQITGVEGLTSGLGTTVGNDFSFANKLNESIRSEIYRNVVKIGELMRERGFRGLFGIDLIIIEKDVYIIEINARQTANIPFQTKLELTQGKIPLLMISLMEWLDLEFDEMPEMIINPLNGAQLFLRSDKENSTIRSSFNSGEYKLGNSIDLDSLRLNSVGKRFIRIGNSYTIENIDEDNFILNVQSEGSIRNLHDEIARIQSKKSLLNENGEPLEWVIELMGLIKNKLIIR